MGYEAIEIGLWHANQEIQKKNEENGTAPS